jgi:hypothetical protein
MSQMTRAEMRKVKAELVNLFKTETNIITKEFNTRTAEEDDVWLRKVNLKMQKARAEQREELFAKQDIQRGLVSPKSKLE